MNKLYYIPIIVLLSLISLNFASSLDMYSQTVADTSANMNWNGANDNYAFSFIPSQNGTANNLTIKFNAITGNPTALVRITTNSGDAPTTNYIANSTSQSVSAGFNRFTLENSSLLTAGTKYFVFFSRTSAVTDYPAINYASTNGTFKINRATAINQEPPLTAWIMQSVTFNLTGTPPSPNINFSVNAQDNNTFSVIHNFSITLNNSNYTTTTGWINTNITQANILFDIFFFNAKADNGSLYFNQTFYNVTLIQNFTANLSAWYVTPSNASSNQSAFFAEIEYNSLNLIMIFLMLALLYAITFLFLFSTHSNVAMLSNTFIMLIGLLLLFSEWNYFISLPNIFIPILLFFVKEK